MILPTNLTAEEIYGAAAAAPVARQVFQYLTAHPIGPPDLRPPANSP